MKNILFAFLLLLCSFYTHAQCAHGTITGLNHVRIGASVLLSDTAVGGIWSSNDTSVAAIDGSGYVIGRSGGTAIITYALSSSCYTIDTITIVPGFSGHTKVCIGDTTRKTDSAATSGYWSSSDTSIARISATTGLITGVSSGVVSISYTFSVSGTSYLATDTFRVSTVPTIGTVIGGLTICAGTATTLIDTFSSVVWRSDDTVLAHITRTHLDSVFISSPLTDSGTTIIHYTSSFCSFVTSTVLLVVHSLPNAGTITGTSSACFGSSFSLYDVGASETTGVWSVDYPYFSSISSTGVFSDNYNGAFDTYDIVYYTVTNSFGCQSTSNFWISLLPSYPYTDTFSGPASIHIGSSALYSYASLYLPFGSSTLWDMHPVTVGSVATDGTVTGLSIGTAILSYTITSSCYISVFTKPINVTPPAIGAISTGFSAFINNYCDSPQFGVSVPSHSVDYQLKTSFGDNTANTIIIPASPISALTTFTHQYSVSGTYSIKQILYSGTVAIDSVTYHYDHYLCKDMALSFFIDANDNCMFDSLSEHRNLLPVTIEVDSNGIAKDTISATSGLYYATWGSTGDVYSFKVLTTDSMLSIACPASGIVYDTLNASGSGTAVRTIALYCNSAPGFDLAQSTVIVAGRHKAYGEIYADNLRCTPQNAIVKLHLSPKYVLNPYPYWTTPTPTSVTTSEVIWDFTGLSASAIPSHIIYNLVIADTTWLTPGDTVHTGIEVTPTSGDADITNNIIIRIDTVKSSFDPNHIDVIPDGNILNGTKLKFGITFENDGNDTAQNIYVMDTLSDALDPSTLRIVQASAVMNIAIIHAAGHAIVKFDFPGIKLLDSTHHSQCTGNVIYNINARNTLSDSSVVVSHAGIFFDDNPVVITDTAYNRIVIPYISIATASGDSICSGDTVVLNAASAFVNTPHYSWSVNSLPVGSDSSALVILGAHAGDTVRCLLSTVMDDTIRVISNNVIFISRGISSAGTIGGLSIVCPSATITLSDTVAGGVWSSVNGHASVSGGVVTGVSGGIDTILYTITSNCGTSIAKHPVVVHFFPTVDSISGSTYVCIGSSITMSDSVMGGGWTLSNGCASHVDSVITGVVAGQDTLTYTISNDCGTAIATRALTVYPTVITSVTFEALSGATVCGGDSVTFIATPVNGGAAPVYQWLKFGSIIGAGNPFIYLPANGDVITCDLISSSICPSPDTVPSSSTTMTVIPTVTPSNVISITVSDSISYPGQTVNIYSSTTYCGGSATYQWYKNGSAITGATSNNYSAIVFSNDTFYCVNHCSTPCATSETDSSNKIIIYADYLAIDAVAQPNSMIHLYPNPNNGNFEFDAQCVGLFYDQVHYDIMNIEGQVIYSRETRAKNGYVKELVELANNELLISGQYVIKIATESAVTYMRFSIIK